MADGGRSGAAKETHARKMCLKFIFVTPRQLIEKEGREPQAARVNVYIKIGDTYEMLGHKEDFRYSNDPKSEYRIHLNTGSVIVRNLIVIE